MAERGFVAIAFDESFTGESSGEPRHVFSPDIFIEDFSAGVDFLGTRPFVDRNQIGVIGICGSVGAAVTAAQVDHRIKALDGQHVRYEPCHPRGAERRDDCRTAQQNPGSAW